MPHEGIRIQEALSVRQYTALNVRLYRPPIVLRTSTGTRDNNNDVNLYKTAPYTRCRKRIILAMEVFSFLMNSLTEKLHLTNTTRLYW